MAVYCVYEKRRVQRDIQESEGEMTLPEIRETADMAETFPNSGKLNFGEISFRTLLEWVMIKKVSDTNTPLDMFDVESVKDMFQEWWLEQKKESI